MLYKHLTGDTEKDQRIILKLKEICPDYENLHELIEYRS